MKFKPDDLQLKVMQVLWSKKEATVQDIQQALEADRAVQTINTVLQRLAKKNVVGFKKDGRQYIYYPLVTEEDTKQTVVTNVLQEWFAGSYASMVNHLLTSSEVNPDELAHLQAMVQQAMQTKKDHE